MITVYGIKNCDTMKKAFKWLDKQGVEYQFHDYKKEGVDANTLSTWSKKVGWETLLNRRGTTWRKLPDKIKDNINEKSALKIMQEQPSIIKRPVLKKGASYLVGFDEASYKKLLG